jgi:hypothetical protein
MENSRWARGASTYCASQGLSLVSRAKAGPLGKLRTSWELRPGLFRDFWVRTLLFVSLMFANEVFAPCVWRPISLINQRR